MMSRCLSVNVEFSFRELTAWHARMDGVLLSSANELLLCTCVGYKQRTIPCSATIANPHLRNCNRGDAGGNVPRKHDYGFHQPGHPLGAQVSCTRRSVALAGHSMCSFYR